MALLILNSSPGAASTEYPARSPGASTMKTPSGKESGCRTGTRKGGGESNRSAVDGHGVRQIRAGRGVEGTVEGQRQGHRDNQPKDRSGGENHGVEAGRLVVAFVHRVPPRLGSRSTVCGGRYGPLHSLKTPLDGISRHAPGDLFLPIRAARSSMTAAGALRRIPRASANDSDHPLTAQDARRRRGGPRRVVYRRLRGAAAAGAGPIARGRPQHRAGYDLPRT